MKERSKNSLVPFMDKAVNKERVEKIIEMAGEIDIKDGKQVNKFCIEVEKLLLGYLKLKVQKLMSRFGGCWVEFDWIFSEAGMRIEWYMNETGWSYKIDGQGYSREGFLVWCCKRESELQGIRSNSLSSIIGIWVFRKGRRIEEVIERLKFFADVLIGLVERALILERAEVEKAFEVLRETELYKEVMSAKMIEKLEDGLEYNYG